MIFLNLALKSIRNRRSSALLTIISIALSVTLLLSVERTKRAAEEGFTQSISQVDLIVGARTGPLNLILFTVFNMGSISNNISWESYQKIKSKPEVEWTIPYSLGDGHKGFRVVGTDENFYQHYRYRGNQKIELAEGAPALDVWDVAIGSDVQKKLKYKLGDRIVVDHGVTKTIGVQHHDDKPFHITGIMKPTGTALDQSLYISLYGMEAMHSDWHDGAVPKDKIEHKDHQNQDGDHPIHREVHHEAHHDAEISKDNISIEHISSFFLRTKSRIETLRLQRDINEYKIEPLSAVIPGVALSELWRGLSQIEVALRFISLMVITVGLASMVSSLLSGLNERRREMSILRSLGAGSNHIMILMVLESCVLTLCGILMGVLVELCGFSLFSQWLEGQFGLSMVGPLFTITDLFYLVIVWVSGTLVGFLPALKASYWSLKDGLSVKS